MSVHAHQPKAPGSEADSKPVAKDNLQTLPLAEVEKKLGSSPEGLTDAEAKKRLTQYGPNEIEEKKTNGLLKFLSYFWGPIPWMIEVAVILSGIVGHWPDFFIILVLLVSNAVIGFWEEREAGNAIDALKARLAIKARVKRDGKWVTPPAKELVPGDVVRLRLGDIVPADARLLDGDELSVDQSALTGESLPATRKFGDAVFSGSIIRRGEIDALVYATGAKTYFGKTAELVETAVTVSHFQKAVLKIGDYLIILAVVMVGVIVGVSIYRGDAVLTTLQFALVLTVAAIPVAMPTVLSVTMAVGARLLAKKQAIVSKLIAIEELAGVDVLCADKTGTLTQNKLTLGTPFCLDKTTPDELILSGALASRSENDDTIDLAVLGGLKDKDALKPYQVTHFTPFDPVHKRTEATVKGADGKTFKVTKGAPQVIQAMSANAAAVKGAVDKAVDDFAARGFRALGVARADADGKWRLLGILPLFDPPRDDAKSTIATAAEMGVKIKMVTGDALAIAREMAKTLGMGANILDGASLGDSKTDETPEVAKSIEDADGFAQVFPEHKFHIVDVLQKHGHIVGMTGDGVNDAPALKKADCGFAVSGATDAARAAASIVLVTPGLSVIIDAMKESRRIFQRMNSYAIYRIAETLRVLLFMTLAIVVFNFFPLTAIMIVMLALLNDGAILSIAYDNVIYRNKPEAWDMRTVLGIATVLGLVGPLAAFGLFYIGDRVLRIDRPQLQTMMYLLLSVAGHLTIFQTRTRGPWWSIRPARILLLAVVGTQTVATLICVFGFLVTPLWWGWAALVWGYALSWFLVTDPIKLLAYHILDATKKPTPKRQGEAEPKADAVKPDGAKPKPAEAKTAEPKPDAAAGPQSDVKADSAKADATAPDATKAAAAKPNAKSGPQPGAKADAEPQPDVGTDKAPEDPKDDAAKPDAAKSAKSKPDSAKNVEAKVTEPKPNAASGPQPAKGDGAKADDAAPDATKAAAAKPDAKSGPQPNAAPDNAKGDSADPDSVKGGVASPKAPKPSHAKPDAGPQSDVGTDKAPGAPKDDAAKPKLAKSAESKPDVNAQPEADANAGFTKLMHTTLGDVLLAGLANHPHSVERIVAEAVTKAEAAPEPRSHKRKTPKPSRSLSRNPSLSRKPKPSPSRHPKPSPAAKPRPTRRPK
jgi:H+-transporting ATPase